VVRQILYVHGMDVIGGAEKDLLALVRRLDRTQWSPLVACPEHGAFRTSVEALGIPVLPVGLPPWRKLSSILSRYSAVTTFSTLLSSLRPALIHVNDIWWVPHTVRAVKRLTGSVIPVIAHVRQNIKPRKVRAYSLDRADYVFAVSSRIQAVLQREGVRSPRVSTLYSGVDLTTCSGVADGVSVRTKHGIPSDAPVIGTVANLLPIKGYEIMIEALSAIIAKVPTAHYLIVGAGSDEYRQQLQQLCRKQGLIDRVHFVGFQDPVWPYLSAMDLYVQPSLDEALPIATVEAMAMGKAIVATRVGGLPETVVHGETGLLVSPGHASELSEAVVALLQDRQRREQMGARGLADARERFDVGAAVARIEQVYHDLLARGGQIDKMRVGPITTPLAPQLRPSSKDSPGPRHNA